MKIKCKVCRRETEIDELDYKPGDKVIVECSRCGNEMEVVIPIRENETIDRPKVRVVNQATEGEDSGAKPHSGAMSQEDLKSIWYAAGKITSSDLSEIEKNKQTADVTTTPPSLPPSATKSSNLQQSASSPTIRNTSQEETQRGFPQSSATKRNKSKDTQTSAGKITIIILIIIAFVVGSIVWLHKGYSNNGGYSNANVSDSTYSVVEEASAASAVERAEIVDEYDTQAHYIEPDTIATAVEVVENIADNRELERVFIPSIAFSTSSEAYDVYPTYVTDERFGDEWATSHIIQNAIRNGWVEYFVTGEGDIEGYPLSIDAVRLKDGRLYGRYHNDYNGVKLDINGGYDKEDNLIVKLGHKNETSYWVLRYEGMNDDGSLQYKGSWGKKNKSTSLRLWVKSFH